MIRVYLHALICLKRHWCGQLVASEALRLSRAVEEADVCIDIGAHCGSWTLPLSCRVSSGRVIAVEALPHYAALLRLLTRWLQRCNVEVLNCAATDRPTTIPLLWKDRAGRRLTGLTHIAGKEESKEGALMIEGRPLDSIVPPALWDRVRLIKCDIEGAELHAFRGGVRLIDVARPLVFCEINAEFCRRYGHTAEDVFAFFTQRSFGAFIYDGVGWQPTTSAGYSGKGDVLFVPDGSLPPS